MPLGIQKIQQLGAPNQTETTNDTRVCATRSKSRDTAAASRECCLCLFQLFLCSGCNSLTATREDNGNQEVEAFHARCTKVLALWELAPNHSHGRFVTSRCTTCSCERKPRSVGLTTRARRRADGRKFRFQKKITEPGVAPAPRHGRAKRCVKYCEAVRKVLSE